MNSDSIIINLDVTKIYSFVILLSNNYILDEESLIAMNTKMCHSQINDIQHWNVDESSHLYDIKICPSKYDLFDYIEQLLFYVNAKD